MYLQFYCFLFYFNFHFVAIIIVLVFYLRIFSPVTIFINITLDILQKKKKKTSHTCSTKSQRPSRPSQSLHENIHLYTLSTSRTHYSRVLWHTLRNLISNFSCIAFFSCKYIFIYKHTDTSAFTVAHACTSPWHNFFRFDFLLPFLWNFAIGAHIKYTKKELKNNHKTRIVTALHSAR